METKEIKQFYNTALQSSVITYEQNRWFRSAQARAGYVNTKSALEKYALPYISNSMDILELGPGPGTWTKCLLHKAPNAQYDLVDISEEMLKQASEALSEHMNIQYITSDILEFKPKKQYDFFFSSRIIEYVPQKKEAIATIVDAMKQSAYGYIVTKTPQYNRMIKTNTSSNVHQQQIAPVGLKVLFEQHGCSVEKMVHVTCVFPVLHIGVLDRVLTSVCRKLPFTFGQHVSESYAIVFQKK